MIHPLIQRLTTTLGYPLLDADGLDRQVRTQPFSVLFFAGDPQRFPEALDVAVILPELVKAFPQLAPALIAGADEARLQGRYGFSVWPSLVFLAGERYLGCLSRVLDWGEYLERIPAILAGENEDLPRIPVLSPESGTPSCSPMETSES
ncbi:hydrogenase expression/formation protein, HoxO [Azotobacter vinelandii CA]|uniref:Hydrogenase expression/formation protein HoxO n=2 Tax=Azotobacter vinelandii TaxID=354 RepID=HOXO_AZOVI|nr:hydrogenase expression/formation protein HoxO [Azotobacter vinelandii]P40593.1 RecName: Full=Hydrogenase expression/formation protein HoxO [Azotobacter vinelandii]AAA19503.1 hoxO [Azotobacter vinelandii]AAA22128.1 hoxO [Azotobacter vinelandii]ACO81142.1 hydrogenase expression/formation protein, HoxO [Azotobacter vinelandii DJ]AGK13593.1 hydrogenase expression/formation protein, HoxO [Azotobacter vinelandii CA]WKN21888.1 hydrogenase expression/formation protein HoxO [Azotobacter vinelandii]